jgi:hypothetical protein
MLIEYFAQVLSPSVRTQGFYALAVLLRQRPCLKGLVGFKSLVLGPHQEGDCVPGCIIGEGNEIFSALVHWGAGWSPHIGMYLVAEVLGWWANSDLRYRLTGRMREDAGVTGGFLRGRV